MRVPNQKVISINVDEVVHKEFKRIVKSQRHSTSDIIRQFMAAYVRANKRFKEKHHEFDLNRAPTPEIRIEFVYQGLIPKAE